MSSTATAKRVRLTRLVGRREGDGDTAGAWLVLDQGLILERAGNGRCWRVEWDPWLDSRRRVQQRGPLLALQRSREQWLARHGLDVAEFPTRRAALQAVQYALTRDPLPPVQT